MHVGFQQATSKTYMYVFPTYQQKASNTYNVTKDKSRIHACILYLLTKASSKYMYLILIKRQVHNTCMYFFKAKRQATDTCMHF